MERGKLGCRDPDECIAFQLSTLSLSFTLHNFALCLPLKQPTAARAKVPFSTTNVVDFFFFFSSCTNWWSGELLSGVMDDLQPVPISAHSVHS